MEGYRQPRGDFYPTYGVHHVKLGKRTVALCSTQNWGDFVMRVLSELRGDEDVIAGPELISVAEPRPGDLRSIGRAIRGQIGAMATISTRTPTARIVFGTPLLSGNWKLQNAAVVVHNGREIGTTRKRTGATTDERVSYQVTPGEPAFLIPGTDIGLLICSDLVASTVRAAGISKEALQMAGWEYLLDVDAQFIHPDAKSLLVIACWGVGGNRSGIAGTMDPNRYYRNQLTACVGRLFGAYPNIGSVAVVDRCSVTPSLYPEYRTTVPLNAVYRRS